MTEAAEVEFSEAELTGEDTPTPAVETPAPEPEVKEAAVAPAEVPPAPATEPEKVEEKPPKTVPLAALHEERKARQERDRENAELKKQLATLTTQAKTASELISEGDSESAVRTLEEKIALLQDEMDRRDMEYRIKAEVPDLLERSVAIEEMLLGKGLSPEAIRGVIGGAGREVPALLKVFADYSSTPKADDIRAQVAAELTPQITAEVTRQLMTKFNIVEAGKDIGKLPGAAPTGKLEISGEADFAKLTPEQQEKWLSGEL